MNLEEAKSEAMNKAIEEGYDLYFLIKRRSTISNALQRSRMQDLVRLFVM